MKTFLMIIILLGCAAEVATASSPRNQSPDPLCASSPRSDMSSPLDQSSCSDSSVSTASSSSSQRSPDEVNERISSSPESSTSDSEGGPRGRRPRTSFSLVQSLMLERVFQNHPYPDHALKTRLASELKLTDTIIVVS